MPATGEEAHLSVDRVTGPGGQRWWSVALVRAEGDRSALDGYPAIEWWPTRDKARRGLQGAPAGAAGMPGGSGCQ